MKDYPEEINAFLNGWPDSSQNCKNVFIELLECLLAQEGTGLEFYARPGVTYSLRAVHPRQIRPLHALVDVIDDEPRWLSVCFYLEMVTDPDEWGDIVPGGLLGEDGLCFDMEDATAEQLDYLKTRMGQAHDALIGG